MKSIVLVAALLVSAPALAADPVLPATTPVAAVAVSDKPSIDMTIEALMADPKAKAVLDADVPGMSSHPMYDSFKGMTLTQLAPMSQGKITDDVVKKVAADLAAIK